MKKFIGFIFIFALCSTFAVPLMHATENIQQNEISGSGKISGIELTGKQRGIISKGSKKIDGYWWNYSSSWNTVASSYDNNQPHSASVKADGKTAKTSTNKKNARVIAALSGGTQFNQSVYYNYW